MDGGGVVADRRVRAINWLPGSYRFADMVGVSRQRVAEIAIDNDNLSLSIVKNTQNDKAKKSGIGLHTQRKVDYLTREAKDLLQRTLLPKGDPNRLSIHGAYKLARGLQDPIQVELY